MLKLERKVTPEFSIRNEKDNYYGSTGCRVFKWGIQKRKDEKEIEKDSNAF
jgi:hypothetical protein